MLLNDPTSKIETGIFRTAGVRSYGNPQLHTIGKIPLSFPNSSPPTILLGLTSLDTDVLRVRCNLLSVTPRDVDIDVESWGDTKLYSAGCSWLSIPQDDTDLQYGRFDTLEDHPITKPQKSTKRRITFACPYYALPKVVVWLEAVSTDSAHHCRIKATATNITVHGFTIEIDTWFDTNVLCARVAWFAHSADRKDMRSGTFSTDDVRTRNEPRSKTSSYTPFSGGGFAKKPRVFCGINLLSVDKDRNLRVEVHTSNLTMNGMTWHLDSWGDTILYGAGASYIAFDQ
ncbi:hypothetical protein QCA50_010891 [Cerrena zonata]|uniref:H-type lectin domain-containing protein n=1 Tax=Cerrena zonata TaxID=2478898 RepID=A0AAW0G701_9APHY